MTNLRFPVVFIATLSLSALAFASEPLPEPLGPEHVGSILDEFQLDPAQEEALRFVFQLEPYDPDRFEGLIHSDFYAVAGTREIADACFAILEDDRFQNYWTETFHALGIMASVEPERLDFEKLTDAVRQVEESDLPATKVLNSLQSGYTAVARYGINDAESFLVPRMRASFWESKERLEQNWASEGQPPRIVTPRDLAIRSFGALGEPEAPSRLESLLLDELKQGDEVVEAGLGVVEGIADLRRRSHKKRVEIYRGWQEKQSEPEDETDPPDEEQERGLEEKEESSGTDERDVPTQSSVPDSDGREEAVWRPWFYGGGAAILGALALMFFWRSSWLRGN